jgi:hypothetical protein
MEKGARPSLERGESLRQLMPEIAKEYFTKKVLRELGE